MYPTRPCFHSAPVCLAGWSWSTQSGFSLGDLEQRAALQQHIWCPPGAEGRLVHGSHCSSSNIKPLKCGLYGCLVLSTVFLYKSVSIGALLDNVDIRIMLSTIVFCVGKAMCCLWASLLCRKDNRTSLSEEGSYIYSCWWGFSVSTTMCITKKFYISDRCTIHNSLNIQFTQLRTWQ